jgi:plastocyanin
MRWLLVVVAMLAFAPAAYGQGTTIQAVDPYSWVPSDPEIKAGESVTWTWTGTHDIKSSNELDDWTAASTTSPYTHRFDTPGTYKFVCSFHELNGMVGTVKVTDASGTPPPPPPPPPPSEQQWSNDQAPPTVFELIDEVRPELTRVRVDAVRNGARVRFRLSERARVHVRLLRAGVPVESARKTFGPGRGRLTVRGRRLEGRYRVEVFARDLSGNRSAVERDWVTVR